MGDCAYRGKRRINFNQDEDHTMRIENNDRGDYVIVTGSSIRPRTPGFCSCACSTSCSPTMTSCTTSPALSPRGRCGTVIDDDEH